MMPQRLRRRMTACRNCSASSTAPSATALKPPPSADGAPAKTKVRSGRPQGWLPRLSIEKKALY